MKTPLVSVLVTAFAFAVAGADANDPSTPIAVTPARTTTFAEVTRQLDPGGSVYGYLSTDQWMTNLSTKIAQIGELLNGIPNLSESEAEQLHGVVNSVTRLIRASGLENLNGIGVSGVQITPELHRTKFILYHGKGKGDGLFWNIMGKQAHPLDSLNFLTTNTAVAAFGDLDFPLLWKTIQSELRQVPGLGDALEKWPQRFERQTRLSWPKLLASLGGEVGIVLTLDDTHTVTLPFGGMELPEPGLLIAVKVNDSLLYDRVSSELRKNSQAEVTDENGLKMSALKLPVPLPIDVKVTVANSGGYFFLATSPALVRETLNVRAGKTAGLRKSSRFAELAKYLPAAGNQFVYADQRFSRAIQSLQKAALAQPNMDAGMAKILQKLLLEQTPAFGMSVSGHTETGWQTVSVGNQDSATALIAAPAVAGVAMSAAMVLPALAKAKERAQSIACMNNMKQIALGFLIWSTDHGDQFPFNVSTAKGGTLELCNLSDGYDQASYRHFQVMSNELNTPKILVCPADHKQPALDFKDLQAANVSYLVHSGKDVDQKHPEAILIYCPIHHHRGYVDGHVEAGKPERR